MYLTRNCYTKYTRNPNNSITKQTNKQNRKKLNFYKHPKDLNAHFLKEEIQMANRYMAVILSVYNHQGHQI